MCQWSVNLRNRLREFPFKYAETLDDKIVARVVPKFHLAAHKESCRIDFSLNYEPGVGRSDMEGPERTWFGLQGGGSTKDQGPGYWSDAMDDKFGHWNWSKLVRLGGFIFSSSHTITYLYSQVHSFQRSTPTPSLNQPLIRMSSPLSVSASPRKHLIRGRQESSPGSATGVSPILTSTRLLVCLILSASRSFLIHILSGPSELEIRRRLTLEEEQDEAMSTAIDSVDGFTQTKYLLYGLDLEEQRCVPPGLALCSRN